MSRSQLVAKRAVGPGFLPSRLVLTAPHRAQSRCYINI